MVQMRFDHAVIAVRDLENASARLRGVGLDVRPGGRHLGFGTENAICRFGLDYIELITVRDAAEAERGSLRGRVLADFLRRHEAGFVGYALAADDLEDVAERLRSYGQHVEGPMPMRRQRLDGTVLEWELLIPGGVAWRRPWPFFIRWGLPDDQRLALETPGTHPVGATSIAGISIAVDDLAWARGLHEVAMGPPSNAWGTGIAFRLGEVTVELVARGPAGPQALDTPGPSGLRLRVPGAERELDLEVLPGVHVTLSP